MRGRLCTGREEKHTVLSSFYLLSSSPLALAGGHAIHEEKQWEVQGQLEQGENVEQGKSTWCALAFVTVLIVSCRGVTIPRSPHKRVALLYQYLRHKILSPMNR